MSDWVPYARLLGLNPYHVDAWPADAMAEVMRWRLAQFRRQWHALTQNGHADRVRTQSSRAHLIQSVKDDLAAARRPLPRQPYTTCRCHPQRIGSTPSRVDPWDVDRPPSLPSAIAALAWLGQTFGRRANSAPPKRG